MKKWVLTGLLLLIGTTMIAGCGLDDAQIAGVTFINNQYAKSDKTSAKERLAKIISVLEAKDKNLYDENDIFEITQYMTTGLDKHYYVANVPRKHKSDTQRSFLIRFPKGTATSLDYIVIWVSNKKEDSYLEINMKKEGDN
ncbi:hypothetical protein [Shimazuella alba]|uniref:Lipoprotein n=1 Tax=Shimazuella alba TaxID=2690964 RepID=A0A6I4VTU7_9BACL|nr:hypothetical protein [Shimazuella alba]MXQ54997.1 hypothetical protein [Shimazuella alba]